MKQKLFPVLVMLASCLLAVLAGNTAVSVGRTLQVLLGGVSPTERLIIFQVRLPRVIAAAAAGAGLSVSGFLLQGNLDNALASPGILGINHGAGLCVLLAALIFPYQAAARGLMVFAGALLVTVLVYFLSAVSGLSRTSVILSGVAVSALCTAVSDVIISLKPETVADRAAFQLGGFAFLTVSSVYLAAPVILVGILLAAVFAPALDLMALGDETAGGLGLPVRAVRGGFILCAALLAAAAVSMCGMISFVGLLVPNTIRLIRHGRSRGNLALCAAYGAAFLVLCDTLARLAAFPYELPCGLILSLMGAPFLIYTLLRRRKRLGLQ